jgi:hypothetical protein
MARKPQRRRVDPATKNGRQGEGGGRQARVLSPKETDKVLTLAGYGMPESHIARMLDMDPDTLTEIKSRQPEVARALENGLPLASSQIAQTLFQKAVGYTVLRPKRDSEGKVVRDEDSGAVVEERVYMREPDLGALIWWEKTRMGYADPKQLRHADADGRQLPERPATVKVYHMPDNGRAEPVRVEQLDAVSRETPASPNGASNGASRNGHKR